MAGDWFSIDHELPDTAQVRGIYEQTDAELDQIIGRLYFLWRLADAQTVDGRLEHTGPKTLARLCGGDVAFWEAVAAVGWVVFEDGATVIPDFTKRFGASAKRRMLDARRAKQRRNADAMPTPSRQDDDDMTTDCRRDDDNPRTQQSQSQSQSESPPVVEEKSREDHVDVQEAPKDYQSLGELDEDVRFHFQTGRNRRPPIFPADKPLDPELQDLLRKACYLVRVGKRSQDWLVDARQGMSLHTGRIKKPYSYLWTVWAAKDNDDGKRLKRQLASIDLGTLKASKE